MKLITKKMAVLVLQAFTVAGILVGLAGVICLFDEMTDIYMLRGHADGKIRRTGF